MSIHLAVGKSARSNRITSQRELSFRQLGQLLRTWPVHVGHLTLERHLLLKRGTKDEKNQAASAKDTAWFSLAQFAKPVRKATNVVSVSGWVGDFDDGSLSPDEISSAVAAFDHILMTTYSHGPGTPRWRLVVPYARPVTPDEHARLFNYFLSIYGGAVDSSTRDPCRLWYMPSCCADTREQLEIRIQEGADAA